jgi:hypothetical protein
MPTRAEEPWEYLVEVLGAPDSADALRRAGELTSGGWELLGVHFSTGAWRFRRPRSDRDPQPIEPWTSG